MKPFTVVSGIAACIPRDNVDTGAIFPSRYLRSASEDLGKALFGDWRYHPDGASRDDFILNRAPFDNSRFLIAGDNFGCGSSREAAVWALCEFGIRALISTSFGDIFYENAFKSGLLPIIVSKQELAQLMGSLSQAAVPTLTVDLEACRIQGDGLELMFQISPARRIALLQGLDEIGVTLKHMDDIVAFRRGDCRERPWIYPSAASGNDRDVAA